MAAEKDMFSALVAAFRELEIQNEKRSFSSLFQTLICIFQSSLLSIFLCTHLLNISTFCTNFVKSLQTCSKEVISLFDVETMILKISIKIPIAIKYYLDKARETALVCREYKLIHRHNRRIISFLCTITQLLLS